MKSRKQWVKYVVLGLMVVLLGTTAACQKKATQEKEFDIFPVIEEEILDSYTVEMSENAYMLIEETTSYRIAEYYVDEKLMQRAVYESTTGEIISWRLDGETGEEIVKTYHMDDFRVTEE